MKAIKGRIGSTFWGRAVIKRNFVDARGSDVFVLKVFQGEVGGGVDKNGGHVCLSE